ncbi:hypothetical protein ACIBHX_16720 [Nonomuraea sp. NPDC050536]|uniref:hypothetical protein n=1 Tax=Nonomuraea sp. NPDC050536 TaxID=3364366 RepID=UPI0037C91BD5
MSAALIFSGAFLLLVLFTQMGRHRILWWRLLLSFGALAYFGPTYLGDVRFEGGTLWLAVWGTLIGVALGVALVANMRVERADGKWYTVAGWPYLGIWVVSLLGRIAFVYGAEYSPGFRQSLGEFMADHHIADPGAWAAFFVLMAFAMLIVRTAGVGVRLMISKGSAERRLAA